MSLLNRFYDVIRDPRAHSVAAATPVDRDLPDTAYVLLVTYRRNGTAVPTPVWAARDGSRLIFRTEADTGKVRRLRHTSRVQVAPCTFRGKPTGPPVEGTARIVGPEDAAGERALARKYRWRRRLYSRVAPLGDLVYVEITAR